MADGESGVSSASWRPRRTAVQHRLDATVHEHRVTIAVVFPVVGAALLVASAEGWLPGVLAFNAGLILVGTLVMRSPLLVGAAPLIDRRAAGLLAVLVAYTYAIEAIGVATGVPYGAFEYGVDLGPMLAGVPLALPLFFIPLAANAYLLTVLVAPRLTERAWVRLPVAIAAVVAVDLVLDPAAVAIGFWSFDAGGAYYGVPLSNYLGWVLSAVVAVVLIDRAVSTERLRSRAASCPFILDDLVSFVLLWTTINLLYLQLAPVAVALALLAGLLATGRYDAVVDPWRPSQLTG